MKTPHVAITEFRSMSQTPFVQNATRTHRLAIQPEAQISEALDEDTRFVRFLADASCSVAIYQNGDEPVFFPLAQNIPEVFGLATRHHARIAVIGTNA